MFGSYFIKFCLIFALIFAVCAGCRRPAAEPTGETTPAPALSAELQSGIPFATREPERFEAELAVTANGVERRVRFARSGEQRRFDFNFGAKNQVTSLYADKAYLLLPERRIYAENTGSGAVGGTDEWTDFLTTEWLNDRRAARFEKLETNAGVTKYRIAPETNGGGDAFVYFDETLGLPVRQEFFAAGGAATEPAYVFELRDARTAPDPALFAVPPDFRKVPLDEFRRALQTIDD